MWKQNEPNRVKGQLILGIILFVLLLVVAFLLVRFLQRDESGEQEATQTVQQEASQAIDVQAPPQFDSQAIQAVLDTWQAGHAGNASVTVMNSQGDVLAETGDIDQVYFAASLYKLYVAYFGYQQVDAGEVDPQEVYVGSRTRAECLAAMIRSSDSPCAETLWNELGKQNLTDEVQKLGLQNTDMTGISTTARDTAQMLALIAQGQGLSSGSQQAYLDSMKDQESLYRRGLPSGFSDSLIVHNKVGWNEQVEWHDASIIVYPDGRQLIIAVLTESVGSKKIAELATALEQATR
jgi:beta-lactamase class A